ncbi:Plasma membrane t-SNARE, secretory vesicle fusion, partial [Lunasporangiospora selenospora]
MSRDRLNDFNTTEVISSKIQQFQSNITEIDQLHERQNSAPVTDPAGTKLLQEKTRATNGLSTEIYDRLRALTEANRRVRTQEEFNQRKLRTSTLSKQFKEAVSRFQGVQFKHGQKSKDNLARQYRIANPSATEDEIKQLVDKDEGGAFSQQLLQQARGQQALAALSAVQSRQKELQQLQESIVELAQLYSQMEHLISDQDILFQQIEGNVTRAEGDLEKGDKAVGVALVYAIGARHKKWIALGLVILIIAIILIAGAAQ